MQAASKTRLVEVAQMVAKFYLAFFIIRRRCWHFSVKLAIFLRCTLLFSLFWLPGCLVIEKWVLCIIKSSLIAVKWNFLPNKFLILNIAFHIEWSTFVLGKVYIVVKLLGTFCSTDVIVEYVDLSLATWLSSKWKMAFFFLVESWQKGFKRSSIKISKAGFWGVRVNFYHGCRSNCEVSLNWTNINLKLFI